MNLLHKSPHSSPAAGGTNSEPVAPASGATSLVVSVHRHTTRTYSPPLDAAAESGGPFDRQATPPSRVVLAPLPKPPPAHLRIAHDDSAHWQDVPEIQVAEDAVLNPVVRVPPAVPARRRPGRVPVPALLGGASVSLARPFNSMAPAPGSARRLSLPFSRYNNHDSFVPLVNVDASGRTAEAAEQGDIRFSLVGDVVFRTCTQQEYKERETLAKKLFFYGFVCPPLWAYATYFFVASRPPRDPAAGIWGGTQALCAHETREHRAAEMKWATFSACALFALLLVLSALGVAFALAMENKSGASLPTTI